MGQIDNLNDPFARTRDMKRQQRRAAHATPGNNMSIGRSGLTVYDGGVITIENGGLKITGTADVIGTLIGEGILTWTGPTNLNGVTVIDGDATVQGPFHVDGATDINGDTTVNGPFHVKGATDITGTLGVSGVTTLLANLIVGAGGKITLGTIVFDPSGGPGGSGLISSGTSIQVNTPTLAAQHDLFAGGNVTASGSVIAGGITGKSGVAANVYVDSNGKLFRVI